MIAYRRWVFLCLFLYQNTIQSQNFQFFHIQHTARVQWQLLSIYQTNGGLSTIRNLFLQKNNPDITFRQANLLNNSWRHFQTLTKKKRLSEVLSIKNFSRAETSFGILILQKLMLMSRISRKKNSTPSIDSSMGNYAQCSLPLLG